MPTSTAVVEVGSWHAQRETHGTRAVATIRYYTWGVDDRWHGSLYAISVPLSALPDLIDELLEIAGLPSLESEAERALRMADSLARMRRWEFYDRVAAYLRRRRGRRVQHADIIAEMARVEGRSR